MRLYLSSFRFGNRPEELAKFAGLGKRVAVIANARDYQGPEHKAMRCQEEIAKLTELGFKPEELDLRDYFNKTDALAAKLKDFDMVWVLGGNVFLLRTAMELSGADEVLSRRIKDDSIIYAGYSAGGCVLSSTLLPLAVMDDPSVVEKVYGKPAVTTGLKILDYVLVPHFESDHPESAAATKAVLEMEKARESYTAISDGEVLVIDGDGSEETVLS